MKQYLNYTQQQLKSIPAAFQIPSSVTNKVKLQA